jgi:hypothetical protein
VRKLYRSFEGGRKKKNVAAGLKINKIIIEICCFLLILHDTQLMLARVFQTGSKQQTF